MTPKRIQRKRTKGWRMPPNTLYVGRGSKWGNPYKVVSKRGSPYKVIRYLDKFSVAILDIVSFHIFDTKKEAAEFSCRLYRMDLTPEDRDRIRAELRGLNLCCWCPLDQPCHADVLLEIANG